MVTLKERIEDLRLEFSEFVREFKKNKAAVIGFYIILFFFFVAILAPVLATHDQFNQDLPNRLSPPGKNGFLLGSDDLGRDILTRILYGARISMFIGIISVGISLSLAILLGVLAGYYGGWLDRILMRIIDIFLAFPFILLTIVIVSVLGPSLINAMIAIGLSAFPGYMRVVRASVLSEAREEYVMADKAAGASDFYIMFRSILPNSIAPIFVQATMGIGGAILSSAALSFLGMGAQPPTPEWGLMISNGKDFITSAWWIITMPGLAVLFTVVGFNLFADGVRDVLDPQLKN